jgi:hypothetical protein
VSRAATSRPKVNAPLGAPPTLEWRALAELGIDEIYQRSILTGPSHSLIRKIAMFWDWGLCQPLAVSRRPDGSLLIVDGQHRHAAAVMRGDIPHLPCVITSYAKAGDEAAAFVALNQQRRPLCALDLFKAAVAAEDTEALTILRAIHDAGLRLAKHGNYIAWQANEISNIGGIQRYFRRAGEAATKVALTALARAWPGEVLRYAGSVFPGFAAVALDEFRLRSDPAKTIDELAKIAGQRTQTDWRKAAQIATAEAGGSQREAAEIVFRRVWRARHSPAGLSADHDLSWCDQCQRKVAAERVENCTDRFCLMRKAKAA